MAGDDQALERPAHRRQDAGDVGQAAELALRARHREDQRGARREPQIFARGGPGDGLRELR